jgi:hypothetical protein
MENTATAKKRILILGGGFDGAYAALHLEKQLGLDPNAWWLWRCIYLRKLPGFAKKVRVALDWILDLVFSKDLDQLPTFRSPTISEAEETSSPTSGSKPAVTAAPKS